MVKKQDSAILVRLINDYLSGALRADPFCQEAISLWRKHRDETYEIKPAQKEEQDKILLAKLQRQELSVEEFERQYASLWGGAVDNEYTRLIEKVTSACNAYTPTPTMEWEIDEQQLQREVLQAMEEYDSGQNE